MSLYVLIIVVMQSSYDGGAAVAYIPFHTEKACTTAAYQWNRQRPIDRDAGRVSAVAMCHATGAVK